MAVQSRWLGRAPEDRMPSLRHHGRLSRLCARHKAKQHSVHRIDFFPALPDDVVAEHHFTLWIRYGKAVVTFDDKLIRNADVVA
jgi:hypothetical protein